jgi:hypothetical protein
MSPEKLKIENLFFNKWCRENMEERGQCQGPNGVKEFWSYM